MRHLFPAAACFTLGTTIGLTFFLALAIFDPGAFTPASNPLHLSLTALLWAWWLSSSAFVISTLLANYRAAMRQWSAPL